MVDYLPCMSNSNSHAACEDNVHRYVNALLPTKDDKRGNRGEKFEAPKRDNNSL